MSKTKQRWTLNVENFGRIKSGKIEISPLMLFVGDNNSGKSYIMSLLWGILSVDPSFFQNSSSLESYIKCKEWLENNLKEEIVINEEIQKLFINWFNDLLQQKANSLISRIFNYPLEIGKLYISNYKRDETLRIEMNKDTFISITTGIIRSQFDKKLSDEKISNSILGYICWKLVIGKAVYLPASRTGFMLTYKTLIYNLIDTGFRGKYNFVNEKSKNESTLSSPVVDFLQYLIKMKIDQKSQYIEIATLLEKEILHGEIKSDDAPVPNYSYKPVGTKQEMLPHVTSSLVSELMPIILFLKSSLDYDLMIIEEPEAHLHPQMQKTIAKAMVRLVNMGLPVWITTHSDTIFQQVNNLIKLYNHPNRKELAKEFGYNEEDFLSPEKVTAYQFNVKDHGKTEIDALSLSEEGFAAPTFNESIIDLAKETIRFQRDDLDD